MKFDSIEDWNVIDVNTKRNCKLYGWRIPILGVFPNIVSSK